MKKHVTGFLLLVYSGVAQAQTTVKTVNQAGGQTASVISNKYYINQYDTVRGYVEFYSTPKIMEECDWSYTESFGTFDRKRKYTLLAIKVINNMTNEFRIITKCGDMNLNSEFSFYFNMKNKD